MMGSDREWAEAHLGQDIEVDGERVELAHVLRGAPVVVLRPRDGGKARLAPVGTVRSVWVGQNMHVEGL